jgi:hypothetical protein
MRLTVDQRLQTLERDIVVLQDTLKLLHKLIKEQGRLINDFIMQKVAAAANFTGDCEAENGRPEVEVYTFICQKRFEKLEKDFKKVLKLMEKSHSVLKAG